MFEQHKTAFFLVCTCEHIAPLNTALCYCPRGRGAGHCVFVWVCVREGMWKRGENTRHTNALFIPPVSIGLVLITEIESYESNQRFCRVWVKVCEKASGSERECMSFNAISRHLWQSLKGVKFVLGFVGGGCVSNRVYRLLGGSSPVWFLLCASAARTVLCVCHYNKRERVCVWDAFQHKFWRKRRSKSEMCHLTLSVTESQ